MKVPGLLILLSLSSITATSILSQATLAQNPLPWSQWAQQNQWWVDAHPDRARYFYSHPGEAETSRSEWFNSSRTGTSYSGSHSYSSSSGGGYSGSHSYGSRSGSGYSGSHSSSSASGAHSRDAGGRDDHHDADRSRSGEHHEDKGHEGEHRGDKGHEGEHHGDKGHEGEHHGDKGHGGEKHGGHKGGGHHGGRHHRK